MFLWMKSARGIFTATTDIWANVVLLFFIEKRLRVHLPWLEIWCFDQLLKGFLTSTPLWYEYSLSKDMVSKKIKMFSLFLLVRLLILFYLISGFYYWVVDDEDPYRTRYTVWSFPHASTLYRQGKVTFAECFISVTLYRTRLAEHISFFKC